MARKKFIWLFHDKTNTAKPYTLFGSLKKAKEYRNALNPMPEHELAKLEVVYGEGRKPKPALQAPPAPGGVIP